jgi:demethoxyubiquinone hydroxylase (CLK1/Coq7/Cat5 family)
MNRGGSIRTLNSFLRGEIAAVASYRLALGNLEHHGTEAELRECLASHERRVARLRRRITDLGGAPAEASELWAAFAGPAAARAGATQDAAAIAALEAGEDQGLERYLHDVGKLDRDSRRIVAREILPEQVRTHDSLSDLKLRDAG